MASIYRTSSTRGSLLGSMKAPSVYGGSGGHGVRISSTSAARSFSSAAGGGAAAGGFNLADAIDISDNKKMAMQNLNDRLASYLEKVRNLEKANAELELKIRQFLESKTKPEGHDCSAYKAVISGLQDQVRPGSDSVLRFNELAMRQGVEADIIDLEMQIEALREELIQLKKNHEEVGVKLQAHSDLRYIMKYFNQ
uniref:IF rod domain-containing protein n=1 Tax=Lates calcarifer TaxID=8187 RepID=A0A4W6E105_LATCA